MDAVTVSEAGRHRPSGLRYFAGMEDLRSALGTIRSKRIYFGHHSVGDDLLRGCGLVAARLGVDPLPIVRVESGDFASLHGACLAEGRVGENQDPGSKIADFESHVARLPEGFDAALMKFCYVDFAPETEVIALFERYWDAMRALEASRPGLCLLHCTVPLMQRDTSMKSRLKQLLGRPIYRDLGNAKRDAFNRLLRGRCGPGRLVDLALAESTDPRGHVATVLVQGEPRPFLRPEYARDAGHLNDLGAQRLAEEALRALGGALSSSRG